jgi:hypothetical protein
MIEALLPYLVMAAYGYIKHLQEEVKRSKQYDKK